MPAIAVLDIGKSRSKLALVDADSRAVIAIRTTANRPLAGPPYLHLDVDGLWAWIVDGLAALAGEAEIVAIATTTHGCAFALLAGDDLALPVLDYEDPGPDSLSTAYMRDRGPFAETLSPDLPNGLNGGRQIHWQKRAFADAFARVDCILPYPQYWVWRLTGEKVAEATSIGCHSDLWNPREQVYSAMAEREGIAGLFPPMVRPWETVGMLRKDIAARTGISPTCRVVAGIHDSNASLFPHLLWRRKPFAVLSTGTWLVEFAPGAPLDGLDQDRDCLANTDAFGRPVPSSRFMAGREFEIMAGESAVPDQHDLRRVVDERIMALPSFVPGTGPYGRGRGRWSHERATLSPNERTAAASLYSALVARACLDLTSAAGPTVVEGPFAANAVFLGALAQLTGRDVLADPDATGTTAGAALLATGPDTPPMTGADPPPTVPLDLDLSAYAATWLEKAGS